MLFPPKRTAQVFVRVAHRNRPLLIVSQAVVVKLMLAAFASQASPLNEGRM